MNKNWNDRADKDLFFTILSVKNIGVISGAEWTTIGNHMRSLGYGFTNEGCRQHFQGLRRAQNKAESNGSNLDGQRKSDPTANPITRRPGPGRGRPRKDARAPITNTDQEEPPETVKPASETQTSDPSASAPHPMQTSAGASEPSSMAVEEPNPDPEEQPAKRQRLDVEENAEEEVQQTNDDEEAQQTTNNDEGAQQTTNDDEAVLALAADGITDAYGPPDYYGEA
ncbi:hypothetical protein F4801DRAFT_378439 [Xylaria longipes]|nr:hypothetical protein F4801DRAFT_378439 [Xylaria longipes]